MSSPESSPAVLKTIDLPLQTRAAKFNGVNAKEREITFSFSSEQPVQQMFGTERLSHAPGAMITKRLDSKSVAFLKDHAWDQQIGKITAYSVEDGRAYATAKLSRSALASEVLGDMEDGIRTEISVGYVVHEMKLMRSDDKGNDDYLITSWEPIEVSSVSVPADYSIGIGRGADTKMYSVRVLGGDSKPFVKENEDVAPVPVKETKPEPEKSKKRDAADGDGDVDEPDMDADDGNMPTMKACPGCGFDIGYDVGALKVTCPQCGAVVEVGDRASTEKAVTTTETVVTEQRSASADPVPVATTSSPGSYTITYDGASDRTTITGGNVGYHPETRAETPVTETAIKKITEPVEVREVSKVITPNSISKSNDMADPIAETTRVEVLKENEEALSKIRDTEHARIREITALGAKFDCASDANEWIRRGKTIQEFHTHILNNKVFSTAPIRSVDPSLGMRPTEQRRYSLTRAILANSEGKLGGFELECSKELEAQVGRKAAGFFVPEFAFSNIGHRASPPDLTALTAKEGQELIQTTVEPSLIPFLRNKMVLGRAGCTMMGGLVGNMALPRQISAATATWNTENFDPTRTGQTFDQVPLNPQRLSAVTAFSKQLLAQSQIDVQVVVRDDLLKIIAIAQDLAGLNGTGAANQPLGILQTVPDTVYPSAYSKTSPSIVFASGYPTWTNVVAFEGNVEANNIDLDDPSCCYIASPAVKALWKTIAKADPRSTTLFFPQFIWEEGADMVGRVNGYKAFATQQLGATNQVIFGKFSDLVIGTWGGIDLITDPYTLASSFQIRVIINLLTTIALRYGPAFCYSTNSGLV